MPYQNQQQQQAARHNRNVQGAAIQCPATTPAVCNDAKPPRPQQQQQQMHPTSVVIGNGNGGGIGNTGYSTIRVGTGQASTCITTCNVVVSVPPGGVDETSASARDETAMMRWQQQQGVTAACPASTASGSMPLVPPAPPVYGPSITPRHVQFIDVNTGVGYMRPFGLDVEHHRHQQQRAEQRGDVTGIVAAMESANYQRTAINSNSNNNSFAEKQLQLQRQCIERNSEILPHESVHTTTAADVAMAMTRSVQEYPTRRPSTTSVITVTNTTAAAAPSGITTAMPSTSELPTPRSQQQKLLQQQQQQQQQYGEVSPSPRPHVDAAARIAAAAAAAAAASSASATPQRQNVARKLLSQRGSASMTSSVASSMLPAGLTSSVIKGSARLSSMASTLDNTPASQRQQQHMDVTVSTGLTAEEGGAGPSSEMRVTEGPMEKLLRQIHAKNASTRNGTEALRSPEEEGKKASVQRNDKQPQQQKQKQKQKQSKDIAAGAKSPAAAGLTPKTGEVALDTAGPVRSLQACFTELSVLSPETRCAPTESSNATVASTAARAGATAHLAASATTSATTATLCEGAGIRGAGCPLTSALATGAATVPSQASVNRYQDSHAVKVVGCTQYTVVLEGHMTWRTQAMSYVRWQAGTYVLFEGDRGIDLGCVVTYSIREPELEDNTGAMRAGAGKRQRGPPQILREATAAEVGEWLGRQVEEAAAAVQPCRVAVAQLGLPLQILGAVYQFNRAKLTFFYDCTVRVDFRQLLQTMFSQFHCRIWMQKVGAPLEDEAEAMMAGN